MKSRVIFIGNIPYDKTETQLIDIFSEVGTVVSFRLVFDRDSGKPKGYGFCTFNDYETAASAVRNLNNYDIGGRQLRVDFAEADKEAHEEPDKKMDPRELAEVLSFLKLMTQSNPEQAALLLQQNPQIAYAVLQALIQMNLVDTFSMQRILQAHSAGSVPIQPIVPQPQLQQIQEQQQQLMLQLMTLTPEQIQQLPMEQQQQVIQLRAQLLGQQGS